MWHQALNYLWKSKAFHSKAEKKRESGDHVLGALVRYSWVRRWSAEQCSSPTTDQKLRQVCLRCSQGIKPRETKMRPPVAERPQDGQDKWSVVHTGVGSQCSDGKPQRMKGELQIRVKKKAEFRLRFQSLFQFIHDTMFRVLLYLESSFGHVSYNFYGNRPLNFNCATWWWKLDEETQ